MWAGTAFITDREAKYSTAWEADVVHITRTQGIVRVEMFSGSERRAYFTVPEEALVEVDSRLRAAVVEIHDREWPAGDARAGAKHAAAMWAISDAVLSAEDDEALS